MHIGLGLQIGRRRRLGGGGPRVFNFAGSLPSGATLERASTGTYFNSSGVLSSAAIDAARFDYTYNGSVWSLAGLLVEPERTNLVTYSAAINSWSANSIAVTADSVTSPDGTANADLIAANGGNNIHRAVSTFGSVTNGTRAAFSAFMLGGTLDYAVPAVNDGNVHFQWADLSDGTADTDGNGYTAQGSENISGGWWRYWGTYTAAGNNSECSIWLTKPDGTKNLTWDADGTQNLTAWGVQLEASASGPLYTSYIPTSGGSTATRSADVLTLGLDDGDWNLSVVTPNGTFTTGSPVTVSGGNGYEFDWSDLTGATTERHIQSITAEAA